jgi:transposase
VLPHLAGVIVDHVEQTASRVRIWARARADSAECPTCGVAATRVHSRYERRLTDTALGGQPVELQLRVRRFVCAEQAGATRMARRPLDAKAGQGPVLRFRHAAEVDAAREAAPGVAWLAVELYQPGGEGRACPRSPFSVLAKLPADDRSAAIVKARESGLRGAAR